MAIATAILAQLEIFAACGFGAAHDQVCETNGSLYDTVWSLNALMGLGTGALGSLLALPAATFFADERLATVLIMLALALLLDMIGSAPFR